MAKLANATALGAVGATLGGSNPLPPMVLRVAEEDVTGAATPVAVDPTGGAAVLPHSTHYAGVAQR